MAQCRITEIFYSLQGETRTVGLPTVFVRLTGCPLRCGYCDTAYAFTGGKKMEITDIVEQVSAFNPRYVTVTGGEPLAQQSCHELLAALCDLGVEVSLETSEALQRAKLWPATAPTLAFKAADIWKSHVKLSKSKGVQAKIAKAAVSVPGALQKGLDFDYEKNLY